MAKYVSCALVMSLAVWGCGGGGGGDGDGDGDVITEEGLIGTWLRTYEGVTEWHEFRADGTMTTSTDEGGEEWEEDGRCRRIENCHSLYYTK